MESGKRKGYVETTVITLQNHTTGRKRTIDQHANTCMSKPTRKSHMQKATYIIFSVEAA